MTEPSGYVHRRISPFGLMPCPQPMDPENNTRLAERGLTALRALVELQKTCNPFDEIPTHD